MARYAGAADLKGSEGTDEKKIEEANPSVQKCSIAKSPNGSQDVDSRTLASILASIARGGDMTNTHGTRAEGNEHDDSCSVRDDRSSSGRDRQGDPLVNEVALVERKKLASPPASLPSVRRAEGVRMSVANAQGRQQDNCMFLKVTIVEGRALVGELAHERTMDSAPYNFAVDLQFNGQDSKPSCDAQHPNYTCTWQRARTKNDVRCCVEPKFGEEAFAFVLREAHELPVNAGGWAAFLQIDMSLHVVLTKHKAHRRAHAHIVDEEGSATANHFTNESCLTGAIKRELIGTAEVDWRRALVLERDAKQGLHQIGGALLAVELASTSPHSIVHPVGGILHVRLEIVAPREVSSFPFTVADVTRALTLQASVRSEERRDFYLYADAWWKSFTSVSKTLRKRPVKIFAEDEQGQHRCVCSFVNPYRRGRLLPTPRHAARFISLLPFQRRPCVGEQHVQSWNSPHSFLAAGRGDASDHVLLLCSLLLGFGLDAFVCIGRVHSAEETEGEETYLKGRDLEAGGNKTRQGEETEHIWVCTFSGPRSNKKAFFWETLTGQRFSMFGPRSHQGIRQGKKSTKVVDVSPHHFSRVSCMFNHREFFANKQADDRIGHTSFDLSDAKLWKPMDSSRIIPPDRITPSSNSRNTGQAVIVLCRPTIIPEVAAECVELEVKRRVIKWRENQGLSTVWDDDLGFLLSPAVFAYEQERVSGASSGGTDFQDAVQGAVPDRHCFKGFAVRSMVFPYPDDVLTVWLMLACRFEAADVS